MGKERCIRWCFRMDYEFFKIPPPSLAGRDIGIVSQIDLLFQDSKYAGTRVRRFPRH